MIAWLTSLRDRPIAERERRTAITVVAVLLAAGTILLAATKPAQQPRYAASRRPGVALGSAPHPAPSSAANAAPVAPVAARVAQRFLAGYLAYPYGHAPATAVRDATPALLHSLSAHPALVPPAVRARHPRVLSLHPAPAPLGLVGVSSLVNDGELVSYHVVVLLAPERGRLLVSTVEGT
jgi:hypothetical protein